MEFTDHFCWNIDTPYITSPQSSTDFASNHRRSHSWTSPTKAQPHTIDHQITNTLSSRPRLSPSIPPHIASRSPSLSCIIDKRDRLTVPPPPRQVSRYSLPPPSIGKIEEALHLLGDISLEVNASPTSLTGEMTFKRSDSSNPVDMLHFRGERSHSVLLPERPDLRRQKSFSSLAGPRLTEIEVTSRWSTESSRSPLSVGKLTAVQRMSSAGSLADSRRSPSQKGFRTKANPNSGSVAKTAMNLPHLWPSHQRHVSASMVSSSLADFVISPPLEARPREREKLHRRATTSRSRQPCRLSMSLAPPAHAGRLDISQNSQGLNLSSVDAPMTGVCEQAKATESAKPLQRVEAWSKGFLGRTGLDLSTPKFATGTETHQKIDKAPPFQDTLCVDTVVGSGEEEEIEVFSGFDDI